MSSVTRNLKSLTIPCGFLGMLALSTYIYQGEPYVYRSSTSWHEELPVSDASQLEEVDSRLTLDTRHGNLEAVATYRFRKDQGACEIIFATNAGLLVDSVRVNGKTATWRNSSQPDRICVVLPSGRRAEVELTYHGTIKNPAAGLFVGYICDKSVYLLENSYWLLKPLTKNSEAIQVSGSIIAPKELTVATPGRCDSVVNRDATRVWSYNATTTSLNMGVFASDYRILRVRAGDMDVEFYVSSRHEGAFRATELDQHAQQILEHYQASIGPYPFEGWPIKVVEVPIYKPGGHSSLNVVTLAENMLHRRPPVTPTDEILFLAHDLKLIAHELAHQWWGSGVEVVGQDEWTSEGLTEYTVYRYYADKHPGTATDFIVRSWQTAVDADRNNYYVQHPEVLKHMRPDFAKQKASGSLATRVYNAMPLKLIQAEQHLGVDVFQEKLSAVYRNHCRGVLHLDEFLAETELTKEVMALD